MNGRRPDRRQSGAFTWAELNARGMDKAIAFYSKALGWNHQDDADGRGPATLRFVHGGDLDVAGGMEMSPMVPAEVPSYWMVYFAVADVDETFKKGHGCRRPRDARSAGLPGWPLRDPERPAGCRVRDSERYGPIGPPSAARRSRPQPGGPGPMIGLPRVHSARPGRPC